MAVLTVCVFAAAACSGTEIAGDDAGTAREGLSAGRSIFVQSGCGACHVLRDAGTTGRAGPNLDRIHPDQNHVGQFVLNGGVGMPSFGDVLTHEQILTVARYVAEASGY